MVLKRKTYFYLITVLLLVVGFWGVHQYLQIQKARKLIPLFTGLGPDGKTQWDQVPFEKRQQIIRDGRKVWDAMSPEDKARFRVWLSGRIVGKINAEVGLSKNQQYNIQQIIITAIKYREDTHPERLPDTERDKQFRETADAIGNEIRDELTPVQQKGFDELRGRMRPKSTPVNSN